MGMVRASNSKRDGEEFFEGVDGAGHISHRSSPDREVRSRDESVRMFGPQHPKLI
jgi:hypothetical protein